MTPEEVIALAVGLVQELLSLVGHDKAQEMLRQEYITQANQAADAIEAARGLKD